MKKKTRKQRTQSSTRARKIDVEKLYAQMSEDMFDAILRAVQQTKVEPING